MRLELGLVVALAACSGSAERAGQGGSSSSAPAAHREDVDVEAFFKAHAEGAQVVDVRTDDEWMEGHVPGAIHVPVDEVKAGDARLASIDPTKPVYFICAVGGRSAKAADKMAAAGWKAVSVSGGTRGWIANGHPVEKP